MILFNLIVYVILGWFIQETMGYPLVRRGPKRLQLAPIGNSNQGYAKMDFEKVKREDVDESRTVATLEGYKSLYYLVDIEIGTPRQSVRAMLDTGSSDVIIESIENPYCKATDDSTKIKKQLEAKKSTTKSSPSSTATVKRRNYSNDGEQLEERKYIINEDEQLQKRKYIINEDEQLQKRKYIINEDEQLQKRKYLVHENSPKSNSISTDGIQNKAVSGTSGVTDCFKNGFFAANLSSSFLMNTSNPLDITYGDGESSTGYYATDDASIAGIEVKKLNFGLIQSGNTALSVLGIGNKKQEALYASLEHQYDNLAYQIAQQKKLKKTAYSIALGLDEGKNGTVIFGGVDTSKVDGGWATVNYGSYLENDGFYIPIDGIELYVESNSTSTPNSPKTSNLKFRKRSTPTTALMDTGSTLNFFPQNLYNLIGKYIPNASATTNGYSVDCSIVENPNNFFRYTFSKTIDIDVPFSNFNLITEKKGDKCTLGMSVSSDGESATLGDPFFRSSYVVFDLDDQTISLAKLKRNLNDVTESISLIL